MDRGVRYHTISPVYNLLPNLEQSPMYNAFNFSTGMFGNASPSTYFTWPNTTVGYLRPVDQAKAAAGDPANGFPAIHGLFSVADLGGWDSLDQKLFSDTGIATQAIAKG